MGFSFRRSHHYIVYLWAFVLSCVLVFASTTPALAQTSLTWEDLQADSTRLRNPYEQLTTAQTYRLSDLYQLRDWVEINQPAPDSFEREELQRLEESFVAEGIDADELLEEADEAREYWAARSRATNTDITDQSVRLDGYVLPLGTHLEAEGQRAKINEFLLVPYVGACVHVPAPPPNQMVYIETAEPIEDPGMFSPVQVEGELQVEAGSYDLFQVDGSRVVEVSYKMDLAAIAPTTNQPVAASPASGSLLTLEGWKHIPVAISNTLTTALNQIQTQQSSQAMTFALLLAFSYGVLHALGPGHGKAVIVSYFVGQGGSLQKGLLMGGQIALFHVLSAILLAILTNTAVRQLGGSSEGHYRIVQLVSYGAIALIGGWMLRQTLASRATNARTSNASETPQLVTASAALSLNKTNDLLYPSLSQQIQPARRQAAYQPADQSKWLSCSCSACDEATSLSGWLALAVGAVPCSGALLVLLYGLANNMLWQSIAMVVAISVGMAMTLAWIGMMAVFAHRWGAQAAQQRLKKKTFAFPIPLARIGRIISASCVLLLGISLFAATWMTGA